MTEKQLWMYIFAGAFVWYFIVKPEWMAKRQADASGGAFY